MEKVIDTDAALGEITLKAVIALMAENKVLEATIECEDFDIHINITPSEEIV